jgi:hypothetical protein
MASGSENPGSDRPGSEHLHRTGRGVLGIGGPDADEGAPDGQSALKLHAGISVIAFVLCVGVTAIFIFEGTMVPAIVFAVIALGCVGAFVWATTRLRAGRRAATGADQEADRAVERSSGTSGATAL